MFINSNTFFVVFKRRVSKRHRFNFKFYSGQSLRVATALSNFTCKLYDLNAGNKTVGGCLEHDEKIVDVK